MRTVTDREKNLRRRCRKPLNHWLLLDMRPKFIRSNQRLSGCRKFF